MPRRARTPLAAALVAVALVAGVESVVQIWAVPSSLPSRSEVFEAPGQPPKSWYSGLEYADVRTIPHVPVRGRGDPTLVAPAEGGPRGSYTVPYRARGGAPVISNFVAGPKLIRVRGARIVGYTDWGWNVLRLPPGARRGSAVRVTVEPRESALIWVGRAVSIASVLTLAGLLAAALLRRRRA